MSLYHTSLNKHPLWFISVKLWFIIRNISLVSIPTSGTELLRPLEWPRTTKVSFEGWPEEPIMWLPGWNFQSHPVICWKGRWAGSWINHQWPVISSIMSVEWSIYNTPKDGVLRASGWVNTWKFGEKGALRAWKLQALSPFPALCIFSIWLFLSYILYNKLVI